MVEKSETRFIIDVDGVYYITSGPLLEYDQCKAANEEQKRGVALVRDTFYEIKSSGEGAYTAVLLKDGGFAAANVHHDGSD